MMVRPTDSSGLDPTATSDGGYADLTTPDPSQVTTPPNPAPPVGGSSSSPTTGPSLGANIAAGTTVGANLSPKGTTATYSDPYSMINALLAQGVDPNSAVNQVNAQFNLPSGQSLAYYAPGTHGSGSGAVVGLPSSVNGGGYLAQNGSTWGYNVGDSGGGASGSTASSVGGTTFADPAYQALNSLAQSLATQLQQPYDNPQLDALQTQLQQAQASNTAQDQQLASEWGQRVTQLQQPLLSQPQVVQQEALASNNLLASRDAALQNAKDSQSARGFAPTSGLAADQAQQINQNASNQQAQINAQLQQSNISTDESRQNEATQLQGLITQALQGGTATNLQEQAQAADLTQQQYALQQQNNNQALSDLSIPVSLTNQGFTNANSALTSPSSSLSSLTGLIQQALGQQSTQFGQSQSQSQGLATILGNLLTYFGV